MRVSFRVDASPQIGIGHYMRCLTLADELKKRGSHICFVTRHLPDHLREMLVKREHELALLPTSQRCETDELSHSHWLGTSQASDAEGTLQALGDGTWDWLVVDHYGLDARWELTLRTRVTRILVIDDLADREHDCELLLDQNFYEAMDTRYCGKVPKHCALLLGPRYALLSDEYRLLHNEVKPRNGSVNRVLVSFGGSDPGNHTIRAIKALAALDLKNLVVYVVIGAQHPLRRQIESECATYGFVCDVQTSRMAELIAATDLAIGAGGSTSWERSCLGLPTLTLCIAENQRQLVEDGALNGLLFAPAISSKDAGSMTTQLRALLDNPLQLRAMSRNGMKTVDGRGVQRVLRAMGCRTITVRDATPADVDTIFSWRNHPEVRSVSRNTSPIEKSDHKAWLDSVFADPARMLLVGERGGEDVGLVRFDLRETEAVVSIYLAPDLIETGIGIELLSAAESWLLERRANVLTLHAEVLRDNERSHRLFEGSGYKRVSTVYEKNLGQNE